MITVKSRDELHKVVILNPKGGAGKTTLASNLGSAIALTGSKPTLIDCDPQGYLASWVEKRPSKLPEVYGIKISGDDSGPIEVEIPDDSDTVIVDMPAAIPSDRLYDYTHFADSLLIPIQPSEIDVHSATRFIAELLLDAQLDRREARLGIVANRVSTRTRSYARLMRFLTSLKIPLIATLRDSQNYVFATATGIGVCEMPAYRARQDIPDIERIVDWIDRRRPARTRAGEGLAAAATSPRPEDLPSPAAHRDANPEGQEAARPDLAEFEAERG